MTVGLAMKEPEELKNQVCPECGSTNLGHHGYVLTKKWGKRPRLKCKRCASTFYKKQEVRVNEGI